MRKIYVLPALLALSGALYAQSNYAALRGSVTDPQQRAIPQAHVRITSTVTGATREVLTDGAGLYDAEGLAPGPYTVQVDSTGFNQRSQLIQLEVGQQMTLDQRLQLGKQAQTISVSELPQVLKTEDASVGEVVDRRSVQQLPLNGRQLIDLVTTVSGAHQGSGAQQEMPTRSTGARGSSPPSASAAAGPTPTTFSSTAPPTLDPTFNTQNFSPSPDSVQEFQVQTGSYAAEMGGAGGGQINIATRSGTSQLHGSVYEVSLRNGAFDAHTFGDMGVTNHLVQNNYGAALGGPVYGKRTFFFVNYEGYRHVAADAMTDTVPTETEANGDFSQSGVTIFDPETTAPNPDYNPSLPLSKSNPQSIRQPFPNNVIPANSYQWGSGIMLKNYIPRPNMMDMGSAMNMNGQPGVVGAGNDANNYLDIRNEEHYTDQGTVRIDRNFNAGSNAFFRYSAQGENGFSPENLPGFGYFHDNLSQQGVLGWSQVLSRSHMLNIGDARDFAAEHGSRDRAPAKSSIVGAIGHPGHRLRRPGGVGRTVLQRAGLFTLRRQLFRDANALLGHNHRRSRYAELADRAPQSEIRGHLPVVHLADVGLLPEPRLLSVHQRLHHPDVNQ